MVHNAVLFSVFEKDLDWITCSCCLLKTSASLPPSLPHSLCTVFSPALCPNLPASPFSLSEECGRTCYSDACMTCWWQGLHSCCCCLRWLFSCSVSSGCSPCSRAGFSQSLHCQKQDLTRVTWELELEQTFDVVLRLIEMSTPSQAKCENMFYL